MLKRIFCSCISVIMLLTGCGNANIAAESTDTTKSSNLSEMDLNSDSDLPATLNYNTTWQTEEKMLVNYPENASYLGSTQEGYFFYIWNTTENPNNTKKNFYFQTWEGENKNLLEDDGIGFSTFLHQGQLILSLLGEDGITVVGLDSQGEQHEYVTENTWIYPMLYGYENSLFTLTYDSDSKSGNTLYTISEIDLKNNVTETVYQTSKHITAVSGDNQYILFVEEDENGNSILYQYDKKKNDVTKNVALERPVVFAVEIDDKVYFSERGNLGDELGGIYLWTEEKLTKTGVIPLVSDDNIIWDGKKTGNRYLWKAQKNGYLFDSDSNCLYVLDFEAISDVGGTRCMEDDGFSSVFKKGKDFYYVKYRNNH